MKHAHLEVVKWLVNEAGQASKLNPAWAGRSVPQVDVTAADNWAVRLAADWVDYLVAFVGMLPGATVQPAS